MSVETQNNNPEVPKEKQQGLNPRSREIRELFSVFVMGVGLTEVVEGIYTLSLGLKLNDAVLTNFGYTVTGNGLLLLASGGLSKKLLSGK